jgi:tetratricopeptide (TPR) repeat protein
MDALKQAELAKQQGQQSAPAPELSLAPTAASESPPPPSSLPELPAKLEDLDAEFMEQTSKPAAQKKPAEAAPRRGKQAARPTEASVATTKEREAIRNVFAAKGMDNERKIVVIAAALGLLAVGAIGFWLWLEFKPVPGLVAANTPRNPEPIVRQGSIAAAPAVPTAAVATPPMATPAPTRPTTPQSEDDEQETTTRAIARPSPPRRHVAPPLPADAAIRITSAKPGVAPGVEEGYRQLQAGNLVAAKAAYTEALRGDPRNADALHGIAAIALRQGKPDEAEAAYLRILEANPADPTAQAAMVGLGIQGDPVAGESRMKSLLAAQGELPVVNFALGNLYARQQRWNDAQQAYFKAITADAGNPDYLFNLAVSLDQLHQPKLAAQYYDQALKAAEERAAAFDRTQAEKRLRELQP